MTDFELFQSEFKKWQDKFGLSGWQVFFKYEKLEDGPAMISRDLTGMTATIRVNSELSDEHKDIVKDAKHEAIHLLLSRFSCNAYSRHVSSDEIYESEEELVHKLEGLIT